MKKLLLALLPLIFLSCGGSDNPAPPDPPQPPAEAFTFGFEKSRNPGLAKDFRMNILENNLVIAFLPNETDRKSLIATFTTVNDEGILTCNGEIQQSGVSVQDFTTPVKYTLNQNGRSTTYTVKLYPYTGLPVVMFTMPGDKVFTETILNRDDWIGGTIKIDGMGQFDDYQGGMSMKGRGNSTWTFPKKGFNVKMDEKDPVMGMPRHKRWCFIANWRDRTMLRNEAAFRIGAIAANLKWTPRTRFAEVVFNGYHMGTYQITEHIRIDENRVDIEEMKASDISGSAITGGYLLEIDNYYDEEPRFRTAAPYNLPVMSKNPDEDVMQPAQLSYIQSYMNSVQTALQAGNFTEVYQLIDVPSFIDYWIVFALTGNYEMRREANDGPWSVYVHKARDGKLFAGPVWDFDLSAFSTTEAMLRGKTTIHLDSWWYNELFKDPGFRAAVKARFAELKPQLQTIPAYIDSRAAYIAASEKLNWDMWDIRPHIGLLYDNLNGDETMPTLDEAVGRMKAIYNGRLNLIENTLNGL